jgi:hypothetical protein
MPQCTRCRVNPIGSSQQGTIFLSQRMKRPCSTHSMLPKPCHEPAKDCVAMVVLPGFGRCWRTPALNHKCSFDSLVIPTKTVHHLTVEGQVGYRVLALRMKITSRLNADHVFFPPKRRPFQQIDLLMRAMKLRAKAICRAIGGLDSCRVGDRRTRRRRACS